MQISRTSAKELLLLAAFTFAALAVHGYHPATEDAEIYTPGILKLLHPTLFPHNAQFFESHARMTLFPSIIAASIRLTHLPVSTAFFAWQMITSFLFLWGCRRIARLCFAENFAAWCGVALTASLFTLPVAGTALLVMDPYLTTRSFSTPCSILAVATVLEGNYVSAVLWMALTAAIHPLMSFYSVSFIAILLFSKFRTSTLRFPDWIPGLCQTLFPPVTPQYREILQTRPYFFPCNWAWYEWLGLFAPFVILLAFARIAQRFALGPMSLLCRALAIYGVVFTSVAALICRKDHWENLAEIQPLRFLHLLYVLMFLFAGGLIGKFLLKKIAWRWFALFVPLCGGMAYAQQQIAPASAHLELPGLSSQNAWVQAFEWIRDNTPEDAYFALNPHHMALPGEDQHGFRAIAQRSMLADTVKDSGAASMFPELASPWAEQRDAQSGWEKFTRADLLRLKRFGVNWVVLEQPSSLALPCPYQTNHLLVCRLE